VKMVSPGRPESCASRMAAAMVVVASRGVATSSRTVSSLPFQHPGNDWSHWPSMLSGAPMSSLAWSPPGRLASRRAKRRGRLSSCAGAGLSPDSRLRALWLVVRNGRIHFDETKKSRSQGPHLPQPHPIPFVKKTSTTPLSTRKEIYKRESSIPPSPPPPLTRHRHPIVVPIWVANTPFFIFPTSVSLGTPKKPPLPSTP